MSLDPQLKREIAGLHALGVSKAAIARQFGVHPGTVRRVLLAAPATADAFPAPPAASPIASADPVSSAPIAAGDVPLQPDTPLLSDTLGAASDDRTAATLPLPQPPVIALIERVPTIGSEKGGAPLVVVTDAGLERVEALAADATPLALIAKHLGCNKDTFNRARKRDPRIDNAIEVGRARHQHELLGILMRLARNGQAVPALFLLKSVHGFQEGRPTETPRSNITISLPPTMTTEAFDEYVKRVRVTDVKKVIDHVG